MTPETMLKYMRRWNVLWVLNNGPCPTDEERIESDEAFQAIVELIIRSGREEAE